MSSSILRYGEQKKNSNKLGRISIWIKYSVETFLLRMEFYQIFTSWYVYWMLLLLKLQFLSHHTPKCKVCIPFFHSLSFDIQLIKKRRKKLWNKIIFGICFIEKYFSRFTKSIILPYRALFQEMLNFNFFITLSNIGNL